MHHERSRHAVGVALSVATVLPLILAAIVGRAEACTWQKPAQRAEGQALQELSAYFSPLSIFGVANQSN